MTMFLQKVVAETRERLNGASLDPVRLHETAVERRSDVTRHSFLNALSKLDRLNIIAEIKRASPSKGSINPGIDVSVVANNYEAGGAAAISVLTEPTYFLGSLDDLRTVRMATSLPILRKDFIVDPRQIYEAACAGADAILLIVAALEPDELGSLLVLTDELGMDAVVEIHTEAEMRAAEKVGAPIIGVNNRDLTSLEVSLDVSRELIKHRTNGSVMISESGISSKQELEELRSLGYQAFLVGETLMRAENAKGMIDEWK